MKIYKRQISPLIVPTDGSIKDEPTNWYDEDEREALKAIYEREIANKNQTLIFVERYVEIGSTIHQRRNQMKLQRVKELMEIERECVTRGSECDRDCGNCELVQDSDELIEAFDEAIEVISIYEDLIK